MILRRFEVLGVACLAIACGSDPSENSPFPPPEASASSTSSDVPSSAQPSPSSTTSPSTLPSNPPSSTAGPSSALPSTQPSATGPNDVTSGAPGEETSDDGASTFRDVTSDATEAADSSDVTSSGPDTTATSDQTGDETSDNTCPHSGNVTYRLNNSGAWPSDVVQRITAAMDEAVYYYNCHSDLSKSLTINYNPGVPTAEGNVDGVISFGNNTSYMIVATAMHEIGHTLGVGYAPWSELIQDGRWMGAAVNELMGNLPANERDSDMYSQRTYITCDNQHFWPYGLNQASEHQSEWSLVNHVRVVAAMNVDKASARGR